MSNPNSNGKLGERIVLVPLFTILGNKGYLWNMQHSILLNGSRKKLDGYFVGEPFAPDGINVSVKYQDVGGTADQKLDYEVRIIKEMLPCPSILVMVGRHWASDTTKDIREWLINQRCGQLIEVFFSLDVLLFKWAECIPECQKFVDIQGCVKNGKPIDNSQLRQGLLRLPDLYG